jgi:drug/metabolite transporter (DMT)-like permease
MDAWASGIAAAVALVLSAILLTRGIGRHHAYLISWGLALGLFALGCSALLWGSARSWTPAVFRVYYLAGAVLTVPVLGVGSVWLLAPRVGRVASLGVVAFAIAGVLVVLGAATRGPVPADKVPEGKQLFGVGPRALAVSGNVAGTALVVGGTVGSIVRIVRRRREGTERARDARYLQANVLITIGVLVAASGGLFLFLGDAASKAVPLAIAAVLIFVGYLRTAPAS